MTAHNTIPDPESLPASRTSDVAPGAAPAAQCLDLVAEMHTRVLDSIAGFRKVAEKAQPEFRPVADAFLAMHVQHEVELASTLSRARRDPAADGSLFGSVNRAAVEIKSWFEDVTDAIMDQIKATELHILDAYTDAQAACESAEIKALLARHASDIDCLMTRHTA